MNKENKKIVLIKKEKISTFAKTLTKLKIMNNINKIFLTLILGFICVNVTAQSKIAHINTTELVASMPEMNDAKAELEKLAKTYETDIQTMASELQSKVKQYDSEAASQSEEENAKRLQEVQGMEQSIRQYQAQAQQELQKKEFDLLKPITEKAQEAINQVAADLGFDYVLDSTQGQGLIVASGKDLMEEVKKKLNF